MLALWPRFHMGFGWLLGVGLALLPAAVPSLAAESPSPPSATAPPETETPRAKLEQLLRESREALAQIDAPGAADTLPAGIGAGEVDERRRTLEQLILTANRSLKNLVAEEEARKALDAARERERAWTSFKRPPPYSLLMIDDLNNESEAVKSNLASAEASLGNYERLLGSILDEAKAAEEARNSVLAAVQAASPEAAQAAKWRLDLARLRSRLLAARAGQFQGMIASQKDRIAAANADLALLERQIATAKANASFSEEDLAKLAQASDERKQGYRKELDALAKRRKSAVAARNQAKTALETAEASPEAEDGRELAAYRLEVAEGTLETVQSLIESVEGMLQLEEVGMKAYHDRRELANAHSLQERVKALDSLGVPREHLWAWVNVIEDEIAAVTTDLTKLDARATGIGSSDPRFRLLATQRADAAERLAMLQRLFQAVEQQRRLVKRWVLEYTPEEGTPDDLWSKAAAAGSTGWQALKKLWNLEVMNFEQRVEVDGQTLTGRIPVTLGMLLRAVLFFLIGYWIAARLAGVVQRSLVARGHLAEPQARTLRNWAMIVVATVLALGTLAVMRIPLTVFAFLGGALAIALGIGTQALLKNFISGIIVLAERKIRVGDIIEVDGVTGTVTEINTRSSVVRSGDDVETLVPNSALL
ncbi:MAG: mechanosensitive ion channel, partial [Akkermansiaceae bacterium]|nr:mechanosensitive ion channel [Akkermansiaceae bacterium]